MEKEQLDDIDKRVEAYEDIDGVSSKKLNFGLWFVKRIGLFKKIFIGFLIVIASVSWAYSLYTFAYYFIKGIDEDELLAKDLVSTTTIDHEYIKSIAPKDLAVSRVSSFNASGLYDYYIEISNIDKNFMARFEYCFVGDAKEIECGDNFIYPNERKFIMALGKDIDNRPTNLKLFISNIKWERINLHKIYSWDNFYFEHTNIVNKDVVFDPAYISGLSEKLNLNVLKFSSENKTPFNYWSVNFNILLYSGNKIIAINQYSQDEFMSEEKVDINISWPGSLARVSKVEIIPEIDFMNDDAYIGYEGGEGEIK